MFTIKRLDFKHQLKFSQLTSTLVNINSIDGGAHIQSSWPVNSPIISSDDPPIDCAPFAGETFLSDGTSDSDANDVGNCGSFS